MKKFLSVVALLAAVPVVGFVATAFADSPGSLAGGSDIYQVRNVTQNDTTYGSSVTAACNDVVKYSVKLSNTDYGQLTNVTVKASLADGTMNASATTAAGGTTSTSGKVSVTVPSKASLSYLSGTTKLYTVDGTLIKTLADGVTSGGVNAGDLKGSTREFLQFEAKVKCETPPPATPVYSCDAFGLAVYNDDRMVTVNKFSYTAKDGASYKNVVVDWGDNSTALITTNPMGDSHQYAADGTYTVRATVHFTVNGKEVTDSGSCAQKVTFKTTTPPPKECKPGIPVGDTRCETPKKCQPGQTGIYPNCHTPTPPTTPTTPTPPTVLPNTGAGAVAGLFAAATVAGTVGYRLFSRRFARQ